MTLTGRAAANYLRNLTPAAIDRITELNTRGDEGWQAICTSLRDAVADAYASGRFDDEESSNVIREIADGEVPTYNRQIMDELRIIGAAWSYDVEDTGSLLDVIQRVLFDVYADAAQALVNWINEQDEDEEDTRSGNCTRCGLLLHWDAESESFCDDAEDEFCENGLEHERAEGI